MFWALDGILYFFMSYLLKNSVTSLTVSCKAVKALLISSLFDLIDVFVILCSDSASIDGELYAWDFFSNTFNFCKSDSTVPLDSSRSTLAFAISVPAFVSLFILSGRDLRASQSLSLTIEASLVCI